jgi:glycosyltransferase involved in cell wall biosynthesis
VTDATDDEALNVLLLAEDFYPKESGGAFIDWNVATYLVEHGDSVTTVTPRNEDTARREIVDGVEIRRPFRGHSNDRHPNSLRGFFRRILFVPFLVPYLLILCWRREFDLIYSTNHLLHPVAAIVAFVNRLPHISFIGFSPSIQEERSILDPLVLLEQVNFRFFVGDRALCRTPKVQGILSEAFSCNVERLDGIVDKESIKSAIDSSYTSNSRNRMSGNIQLIFVGRLVDIKNPTKLPDLVSNLSSEYSLLIIGDGPQREAVEVAVDEAGVGDRIEIAGRLPHEETLQLIYESDILILPSETESYGAVVFEALSLNTPVVASPVGVLPMVDHSDLTIAEIEDFSDTIPEISIEESDGINSETLEEFAADRFAENVRKQMLLECSSTQGIRIE